MSRGRAPTGLSHGSFDGPTDSFLLDLSGDPPYSWQPWGITALDPDGNPTPLVRRYAYQIVQVENDCAGNDFYLEVGGLTSDDVGRTSGPGFNPFPNPTASTAFLSAPSGFVGTTAVSPVCNNDAGLCGNGFGDVTPNVMTRGWMTAARDPVRNIALGFGGNAAFQGIPSESTDPQGRLFEWNPIGWDGSERSANDSFTIFTSDGTNGPVGLEAATMAYHLGVGRMLLFGGREVDDPGAFNSVPSVTLHDTLWSWDGIQWQEITTIGPRPSPRAGAAMAYDEARGVIVMVGGDTRPHNGIEQFGGEVLADTWELIFPVNERPTLTAYFDWSAAGVSAEEVVGLTTNVNTGGHGQYTRCHSNRHDRRTCSRCGTRALRSPSSTMDRSRGGFGPGRRRASGLHHNRRRNDRPPTRRRHACGQGETAKRVRKWG
ncbi:MAG: kelch repeat-containing protein [Myxococcota bacterium]